jgi:hypothetical protein
MTKETGTDCAQDTQEQALRADPLPPDRTDRGTRVLSILAAIVGLLSIWEISVIMYLGAKWNIAYGVTPFNWVIFFIAMGLVWFNIPVCEKILHKYPLI